jgi:hypothetical protein
MVHKETKAGWKKVKRVRVVKGTKTQRVTTTQLSSRGKKHKVTIDLKKGTYRITVKPSHGYAATTSTPTKIRR